MLEHCVGHACEPIVFSGDRVIFVFAKHLLTEQDDSSAPESGQICRKLRGMPPSGFSEFVGLDAFKEENVALFRIRNVSFNMNWDPFHCVGEQFCDAEHCFSIYNKLRQARVVNKHVFRQTNLRRTSQPFKRLMRCCSAPC